MARSSACLGPTVLCSRFLCPFARHKYQYKLPRLSHRTYTTENTSRIPSPAEVHSATEYCSSLLRKYDAPSHTLQAFIPRSSRPAYLALRALNLELARIPDTTSTLAVGALRYQFWRDVINALYTSSPPKKHPISILLAFSLSDLHTRSEGTATLSRSWLLRLVSVREKYGDGSRPYVDLDALERYAEETYSTLLYLTLQSLPVASTSVDHIASHIGKATGIAAVLRGLPLLAFPPPPNHHSNNPTNLPEGSSGAAAAMALGIQQRGSRQGSVPLPLDVMAQAGVKEEDVLRLGSDAPGLRDAVFAVATRANDQLLTARQMLDNAMGRVEGESEIEGEFNGTNRNEKKPDNSNNDDNDRQSRDVVTAFGVFMPFVATNLWLQKLQRLDFDVFRPELRRTAADWRLPWMAFWAFRRRRL